MSDDEWYKKILVNWMRRKYVRSRDDYYGDSTGKVEHNISLDTLSRSKSSSTDLVQILRNWACFTVLFEEHQFSLYWSFNFKSRICLSWIICNCMRWSTNSMEELSRGSTNSNVMLLQPFSMKWNFGQGQMAVLTDWISSFQILWSMMVTFVLIRNVK